MSVKTHLCSFNLGQQEVLESGGTLFEDSPQCFFFQCGNDFRAVKVWVVGHLARSIELHQSVRCCESMQSWMADMYPRRWKAGFSVISHGAPEPTCFCAPLCCVSLQSPWEKPLHIYSTCWINGLWFPKQSGVGWGGGVRPHTLHTASAVRSFLELFGVTCQLFTGQFPSQNVMQSLQVCLQMLNETDRDELCGASTTAPMTSFTCI